MIRSVCFNPVIDRMYFIDDFLASEKFREITPRIFIGGKGVNIARVISKLSEPCTLYSFIGGYAGQLIRDEMKQLGVNFKYCVTDGETRTTINIIDHQNRKETEITESGVTISQQMESDLLQMIREDISTGDIVICSGIPMAGMTVGVYRMISEWCQEKGAKCVLDTNNRYLSESLPAKYSFMKPNLSEIKELHHIAEIHNDEQMMVLARKTLNMGIENLLISTGRNGGNFFTDKLAYKITVPDEPVISTIGSGDSTVAGFCVASNRGYSLENCLKFAMACGVCNAMFPQVGYVKENVVEQIMGKVIINPM